MRRWGPEYSRTHRMYAEQRRAMRSIGACRTAALGGHLEECEGCGDQRPQYNSCGDRHCPMCGGIRMRKWLGEQLSDLLPVPYFHCVFTLPHTFHAMVARNERVIYDILLKAAIDTLKGLAREHWWAEPGIIAILHTWGQQLLRHLHVHAIMTGGGLALDQESWVHGSGETFLFDVFECSAEFKKRFCRLMRRRYEKMIFQGDASEFAQRERFIEFVDEQEAKDWVVYAQPPAAGEAKVLSYLSRYTHRVAISNRRIKDVSDAGQVTIDYKDYGDKDDSGIPKHKELELDAVAFIGRFLLHVLPHGFRRIRCSGILAPAVKKHKVARARELLGAKEPDVEALVDALAIDTYDNCCANCGHHHFKVVAELDPVRGPPLILMYGGYHAA